jgi:hypothetical protein
MAKSWRKTEKPVKGWAITWLMAILRQDYYRNPRLPVSVFLFGHPWG